MKQFLAHYLVILSALCSIVACVFPKHEVYDGYEYLWLLPTTFLIIYLFILIITINKNVFKVTAAFFIGLSWIRYVLIPMVTSFTGIYNGVAYIYTSQSSIRLAILLVSYELIITSSLLLFLIKLNENKITLNHESKRLKLGGNKYIYIIVILVALILYLTIGKSYDLINFIVLSVGSSERIGDIDSTFLIFIRQIITSAIIFLFIIVTDWSKKKFDQTKKTKYVNIALIIALVNVSIIVGERRTNQVYTALIVIFILVQTFEKYSKKIIILITSVAVGVLAFMSIYKHFGAFAYDSYSEAIQSSNFTLEFINETLQAYFFGTQNVAAVIEFSKNINLDFSNLIFDFTRSTFGLSFLVKGKGTLTSELFNTYIYGSQTATGHVISGVGYGYIFFGSLFSPLIVCMNLFIATKLENLFKKTQMFEMKYVYGYMLIRFITNIFVNTAPLISLASNMLLTTGLIYFVASIFRKNHSGYVLNEKINT